MQHGSLVLSDGKRVPVSDGMTIGRAPQCTITIADTKASRQHARLSAEGGVVELEDLKSSNGTVLNGKPVSKRMLRPGDVIAIGTTELRFEAGEAAVEFADEDDGVDLFGDDEPSPVASPAPAASSSKAAGSTKRPSTKHPSTKHPSTKSPSPKPSAPTPPSKPVVDLDGDVDLLEFEDDEVVAATPTTHAPVEPEPILSRKDRGRRGGIEDIQVTSRQGSSPSGTRSTGQGHGAGDDDLQIDTGKRVLQFSKHAGDRKGGLMGDDLGQAGGTQKLVQVLVALAVAGGLGYLGWTLAGG